MKKILFTVTNDLNYDQRMQRICSTLQSNGYEVKLIGRGSSKSTTLSKQIFQQKRIRCFFPKGFLFYAEYNLRLFFYLLFQRTDVVCAIDLDTILPVYFSSILRNTKRVYDAHEYFTQMKEVVIRPTIYKVWLAIERFAVPRFSNGYTVNHYIKATLGKLYNVDYKIVRNLPILKDIDKNHVPEKAFVYQGAVNEGRGFENLIPAMQSVNATLDVYGDGNFFEQTKLLIKEYKLEKKIQLLGNVLPAELEKITPTKFAGIMIVENCGLSLYYSLANKFFDFMMAGIPQICIDYPEYKCINDQYHFAYMIPNIEIATLSKALQLLLDDAALYEELRKNALKAREILNWQKESKILLDFYQSLLANG